jgi:hypothetical protein
MGGGRSAVINITGNDADEIPFEINVSGTAVSVPSQVTMSSGSGQSATVNTAFAQPLKALVRDALNNPVGGVTVTFTVLGSGANGSLAGGENTAVTDAAGIATSSTLTANTVAGGFQVTARVTVVPAPAIFVLLNTPATGTRLALSAPASANAGWPVSMTVTARDKFNNTVTGCAGTVRFTSSDASAALPANSTLTNGTGTFNVTFETGGSHTVTGTDTVTTTITGTSNAVAVSETVTLSALDSTAAVSGGNTGQYHFSRAGTGAALMVNFTLDAASTAAAADYTLSGGSVSFNGSTGTVIIPTGSQSVDVTLIASANATGMAKGDKTLQLNLAISSAYTSGMPNSGTVTIAGNGLIVTTTSDNGDGPLLQGITNANSNTDVSAITFEATAFAAPRKTITVTGTLPRITTNLSINGPAAGVQVTTTTATDSPLILILGPEGVVTVALEGVSITSNSEGLSNYGILTATNCAFTGCTYGVGTFKSFTATGCVFTGNTSYGIYTLNAQGAGDATATVTICASDADSGAVETTFTVAVGSPDPIPGVASAPIFRPQTGLFELQVDVTNTTPVAINGFRLRVTNLPASLKLYNATSPIGSADVYADHPYPMAVGQKVPMTLTFFSPTRHWPSGYVPAITVENLAAPVETATNSAGVRVTRVMPQTDGSLLLEFSSVVGRWYRVKFSSDMTHWHASQVPIKASSNRVQWYDRGPPFTDVPPATLPSGVGRFYLVEEITTP